MTMSHCSWTLFSWKFAPRPKISKYFYYTGQHYHHITSSYQIVISYHHITSSYHIISKKLWKRLSLTVHEPLFLEICPKIQNSKYFPTRINTIIISHDHLIASYHIIISHHHIISSVKNFEKWLSLTVHEHFFPGNLAQDPKFKIFLLHWSTLSSYHIIISHRHITSSYQIIISYHQ